MLFIIIFVVQIYLKDFFFSMPVNRIIIRNVDYRFKTYKNHLIICNSDHYWSTDSRSSVRLHPRFFVHDGVRGFIEKSADNANGSKMGRCLVAW